MPLPHAILPLSAVWGLRRTVVGHEGCIEDGKRSGFVCEPVG